MYVFQLLDMSFPFLLEHCAKVIITTNEFLKNYLKVLFFLVTTSKNRRKLLSSVSKIINLNRLIFTLISFLEIYG